MPDHGERQAEEIERTLATVSNGRLLQPVPDYGNALLENSATKHLSGGRKVNGGIIFPPAYKCPIVNIRAPKWPDTLFWIRAEDFEAAQYIADAVFYLTGRVPFHFPDARFRYPPLCLGTGEVLNTMEKCSAHVAKIAKGLALRNDRVYYKDHVQKFVLEVVKSPEVVQFLNSVRAIPRRLPHLVPEVANSEDSSVTNDGDAEHGTPMEVDTVSEEAIHSLVPAVHVDPARLFHDADMGLFPDLDISTAFIPGFGMDLDEAESTLHSEGHNIPSNLRPLLTTLDIDEDETFRSTEWSDWEAVVSPKPDNSFHTLRYQVFGTAFAGSRLQALEIGDGTLSDDSKF